jgi:uncharacterized Tic20 family protein
MSDVPHNPYESPSPPPVPPESAELVPLNADAKNFAMLCHLISLLGPVTGVGHIIGPLVVWLWKRDEHPFIDEHGKESLNFQISMSIYILITFALWCFLIGIPLTLLLGVADIVLAIIAGLKAANGEMYRYPMTFRFLK